jgi:hypothetical protein
MLTDPWLVGHVEQGRLRPWEPLPGVPIRLVRKLLLTPDVYDAIYADPWAREPEDGSDRDARDRRRSLHAVTGKFVSGGLMAPRDELELLDPTADAAFERLFEFRSGPPRPQSRLFAYVYEPSVWVAVGFHLRSELGDYGDPRWSQAAQVARGRWAALFPGRDPHLVPYPCNTFAKLKAVCNAR